MVLRQDEGTDEPGGAGGTTTDDQRCRTAQQSQGTIQEPFR